MLIVLATTSSKIRKGLGSSRFVFVQNPVCIQRQGLYIIVRHRDQGYKLFRDPRALGCGGLSKARALLRAQGSLNNLYPRSN